MAHNSSVGGAGRTQVRVSFLLVFVFHSNRVRNLRANVSREKGFCRKKLF